jgi:hypothetical protein
MEGETLTLHRNPSINLLLYELGAGRGDDGPAALLHLHGSGPGLHQRLRCRSLQSCRSVRGIFCHPQSFLCSCFWNTLISTQYYVLGHRKKQCFRSALVSVQIVKIGNNCIKIYILFRIFRSQKKTSSPPAKASQLFKHKFLSPIWNV